MAAFLFCPADGDGKLLRNTGSVRPTARSHNSDDRNLATRDNVYEGYLEKLAGDK
jgi:hypothetical protein